MAEVIKNDDMKGEGPLDEKKVNKDITVNKFFAYKNLLIISLSYFLMLTGFSALQNLQSSLHQDPLVGFFTLASQSSTFLLGSLFLPRIVIPRIGYKYASAVALTAYTPWFLAHFYPKFWFLLFTGLINGKQCL